MEKITDVLRRKTTCSIHDEKLQACTEADKGLLWKEQRIAEQIAKVNNCWYLGIINYSMKPCMSSLVLQDLNKDPFPQL